MMNYSNETYADYDEFQLSQNSTAKNQIWSTYDYVSSCIWYITGSISIPANLYLLFLIVRKSPRSLRIYRIFMANVALGDLVFGLSTTLAQIRIIPNRWAFAYVSLGIAGKIGGPQGGYWMYCVMLHSLFYTFLCFPISFGFRYWILIKPIPAARQCSLFCFGLWLIAFAQHILFIESQAPEKRIREYLKENKPQYDLDAFPVSGNHMLEQKLTVITLLSIVLPMFPIYVIVIYFYKKVHKFLTMNNSNMSPGTIKGHRRLIQALTVQAALPLFFIFPPINLYFVYHLELINYTIIEYLVYTIFSFLPACSPLVTIYYVKPYNQATRKFLGMRAEIDDFNATTYAEHTSRGVDPNSGPKASNIS